MGALLISPDSWKPVGIRELEEAAMNAVKAKGNTLVTAGPGAGKTELLGQRGVYLMQTGQCPYPRRVLAISFKRDAAKNLRERFERRCTRDQVERLDSMTFDAFSKQLFDRFWRALPPPWTLKNEYSVVFTPRAQEIQSFQRSCADEIDDPRTISGRIKEKIGVTVTRNHLMALTANDYILGIQSLRLSPLAVPDPAAFLNLVRIFWSLRQPSIPLTFQMIGRLTEVIIRTNPTIRNAIRATYSHLFMDEFQDTTSVQYDLMHAIFGGSDTVVTAVGDDKQKIMGWAGAQSDSFGQFSADFLVGGDALGRNHRKLTLNYRSNARIVGILNILKGRLAPGEPDFMAVRNAPELPPEKICSIVYSGNEATEAGNLARYVAAELARGTPARQIGLLVRQLAVNWEDKLRPHMEALGVGLRNEDRSIGGVSIQDLMVEPYAQAVIDTFELLTLKRGGAVWARVVDVLLSMEGLDGSAEGEKSAALINELDEFVRLNKVLAPNTPASKADATALIDKIESFWQMGRLRGLAPHYQQGEYFALIKAATRNFILECADGSRNWSQLIGQYRGDGQVPLLTITKSKGLEYDLVLLLGLDESDWWSFSNNPDEGHSNFFVAASRARERLFLFFCQTKGFKKIKEIYDLLEIAGVQTIASGDWAGSHEVGP